MPSTKTLPGDLLTAEQAAKILVLDVSTVYAMIRAGEIPYVEVSRRARRIRQVDLDEFVYSHLRGKDSSAHRGAAQAGTMPQMAEYWARPVSVASRQGRKGAKR